MIWAWLHEQVCVQPLVISTPWVGVCLMSRKTKGGHFAAVAEHVAGSIDGECTAGFRTTQQHVVFWENYGLPC
jgi:hypothetical protein